MNTLFTMLLIILLWAAPAHAVVYWQEDWESGITANWIDYGFGHSHSVAGQGVGGSKALLQPYPGGGFIDRFLGATNKQFNIKFTIKLSPGFVVDSIGTKIVYIRLDQSPGSYPNGYMAMMFGNPQMTFTIQGGYDSTDTEIKRFNNCTLSTTPVEVEMQWIFNDPGVANGSLTAWCNGVQSYFEGGRQYRGPNPNSTASDGINNGSNNFVNNIRNYAQFGTGNIYIDNQAVGNARIGSGPRPNDTPPGPPDTVRGFRVTVQ